MSNYIIKNCPCLEDIYDAEFDNDGNMRKILQQQNFCIRNEKSCDKVLNCLLKRILKELDEIETFTLKTELKDCFSSELKFKLKAIERIKNMLDIETFKNELEIEETGNE